MVGFVSYTIVSEHGFACRSGWQLVSDGGIILSCFNKIVRGIADRADVAITKPVDSISRRTLCAPLIDTVSRIKM